MQQSASATTTTTTTATALDANSTFFTRNENLQYQLHDYVENVTQNVEEENAANHYNSTTHKYVVKKYPHVVDNDNHLNPTFDDDNPHPTIPNQGQAEHPQENHELMRGSRNRSEEFQERELQYRRELEQKERLLQQRQMQLQNRDQLMRQYKQQLHEAKADTNSEKERMQQQICEYEEVIRQNVAQIKALKENAQVLVPFGPVAERYSMKKTPHGIAVIVNNIEYFTNNSAYKALPSRLGSQIDEENLCVTWKWLQYEVLILRNLTASELIRHLMMISLRSHENYDSFVCCILSHGHLDGIYGTDGESVCINEIVTLFKGTHCPTLTDKPKLFFIQSCRGDRVDEGVPVEKDGMDKHNALHHSLPSEADFLFGYATPPGTVSWRSPQNGSWYISKLCEVLKDNALQQDLLTMLTMVNRKVSDVYTEQFRKQCPAPVNQLRKQVWFFTDKD